MIKLSDIPFEHWSQVGELFVPRVARLSNLKILSETHTSFKFVVPEEKEDHKNLEARERNFRPGILEVDPDTTFLGPLSWNWGPRLIANLAGYSNFDIDRVYTVLEDPIFRNKVGPSWKSEDPVSYVMVVCRSGDYTALGTSFTRNTSEFEYLERVLRFKTYTHGIELKNF